MRSRGKTQERWIKVRWQCEEEKRTDGLTKREGTTKASIQAKPTQG